MKSLYLAIPGPTNVPREIWREMDQLTNHRGPEFKELLFSCTEKLKKVFKTKNTVYTLTSSGTGAMQAAVANCFERGEKVLVLVNGAFGERFVELAGEYNNLEVERMDFEWGRAVDFARVKERLRRDRAKKIKGVLFQHNETSTGVLNDAEAILSVIRRHGALSVVDSISGLVTAPFYQDEWGADVVLGASQKGFMMPPGLSFISLSEKAWEAIEQVKPRDYYFSMLKARESFGKGQTPFTPAVNDYFGLSKALDMILEEGLENCWGKHKFLMNLVLEGVSEAGLLLFAEEHCTSPAITAVELDGDFINGFLSEMRETHGIVLASGQGKLKGKIFRIAHLGHADEDDMFKVINALELSLKAVGFPYRNPIGRGIKAVQRIQMKQQGG